MSNPVPPGAFPECAQTEQKISTEVLGAPRVSFETRAKSLARMRVVVGEHDDRLDKIEANMEVLLRRPF